MNERAFPKVIVTCIDSWRDDVGANTISSFFSKWDPENVAVVYTKSELPNSPYSKHFFQISENDILHAALHFGRKCGKEVHNENSVNRKDKAFDRAYAGIAEEEKRYNFFRQHRWKIFYLARDLIWNLGAWKSRELDRFIADFDADAIFFPIYPYIYMNKIQAYIAKKAGVRGVAYIADDNYSYRPEWYNPLFLIQRFFLRRSIDAVMRYCDELCVILPKLKEEYEPIFKLPTGVLTRGIEAGENDFTEKRHKLPLKMVYTGNLFIGRDKSILKVVDAIKRINADKTRIQLYIYSHIRLSDKLRKRLNIDGSSYFMGAVPVTEVARIQDGADIVLFVEALDVFNRNRARLSFSTKLTDYFQSGKCIFAVGKKEIAPIDYLERNDCAVIADSEEAIYRQLKRLGENPELLNEYGGKSFRVGKEHHSAASMHETFYGVLYRVSRLSAENEELR